MEEKLHTLLQRFNIKRFDYSQTHKLLLTIRGLENDSLLHLNKLGELLESHFIDLSFYSGQLEPLAKNLTQTKKKELKFEVEDEIALTGEYRKVEAYIDVIRSFKYIYTDKAKIIFKGANS